MRRERWRSIPGFGDHYQISNRGRVRSVRRWLTRSNDVPYTVRGRLMTIRVKGTVRTVTLARGRRSVRVYVDQVGPKVFGQQYDRKETRVA